MKYRKTVGGILTAGALTVSLTACGGGGDGGSLAPEADRGGAPASSEKACKDQIYRIYDEVLEATSFEEAMQIIEPYAETEGGTLADKYANLDQCRDLDKVDLQKVDNQIQDSPEQIEVNRHVQKLWEK